MKNFLLLALFCFGLTIGYAQLRDSYSAKNWRIGAGTNIAFGSDDYISLSINPTLGYYLGKGIESGITAGYQYTSDHNYNSHLFSGGPYLNYTFIPQVFARIQFEKYLGRVKFKNYNKKMNINESALWVGGGYQSTGSVGFRAGIMYNVLYKKTSPIFSSAIRPFAGVIFAL